jgi:hypothetical protein
VVGVGVVDDEPGQADLGRRQQGLVLVVAMGGGEELLELELRCLAPEAVGVEVVGQLEAVDGLW